MGKPAADVMATLIDRHVPLSLVQWLFTYCVRCDQIVTRWHYRTCPCIVITDGPIFDAGRQFAGKHRDD